MSGNASRLGGRSVAVLTVVVSLLASMVAWVSGSVPGLDVGRAAAASGEPVRVCSGKWIQGSLPGGSSTLYDEYQLYLPTNAKFEIWGWVTNDWSTTGRGDAVFGVGLHETSGAVISGAWWVIGTYTQPATEEIYWSKTTTTARDALLRIKKNGASDNIVAYTLLVTVTGGSIPGQYTCRIPDPESGQGENEDGDPVNTLTGAFVTRTTDAVLPATGIGLAWDRVYRSNDPVSAGFGPGWWFSYASRLDVSGSTAAWWTADGRKRTFSLSGGGWDSDPGVKDKLVASGSGFQITRPDQVVYTFDSAGKLLSIADRNGQGPSLTYTAGLLSSVSAAGRTMTVTWDGSGTRISRVTLDDGRYAEYGYTAGRLTQVRDC
ncbi:MAG: hypothetical protein IT195_10430 [Microthrixaceae bacterium]|nr:hypothetical protein [Microthrixaceae bacterium]